MFSVTTSRILAGPFWCKQRFCNTAKLWRQGGPPSCATLVALPYSRLCRNPAIAFCVHWRFWIISKGSLESSNLELAKFFFCVKQCCPELKKGSPGPACYLGLQKQFWAQKDHQSCHSLCHVGDYNAWQISSLRVNSEPTTSIVVGQCLSLLTLIHSIATSEHWFRVSATPPSSAYSEYNLSSQES